MMPDRNVPRPGYPGRGFDPTGGFTDYQWYFYHQQAIAYFGAFSTKSYDFPGVVEIARSLVAAAPHYAAAFRHAGKPLDEATLAAVCSLEDVTDFDGFPERWLEGAEPVFEDADRPLFRVRVARRIGGADANGRNSFVLVRVAHALTEGSDSARLLRSRSAEHSAASTPLPTVPLLARLAGGMQGALSVLLHIALSPVTTPHPGRIVQVSRVLSRHELQRLAHRAGLSQRALFMALVAHVVAGAGAPGGKSRISCAYTTMSAGGGPHRDTFMRMRMLYTAFRNHPGMLGFARGVEDRLSADEAAGSAANDASRSFALSLHRWLSRRLPWLYSPRFFAFWPYDVVFSLLTPHEFAGGLSEGLLEPVYCGVHIPGAVGCIVVPGRKWVTFNFFLEEGAAGQVARLDAALAALPAASEAGPATPP